MSKNRSKNYDHVMSRVVDRSRSNLNSNSMVTRHEYSSSVRVGAKPSVSNVGSGGFSELPTVLDSYVPETRPKPGVKKKQSIVKKPKKTLTSLDPAKSPPHMIPKLKALSEKSRGLGAQGSTPCMQSCAHERWDEAHIRQCYSSRSHTKLKELKKEIKAYSETEKLLKLRSNLYRRCGVVLDDAGAVAVDKAVQAQDSTDVEVDDKR